MLSQNKQASTRRQLHRQETIRQIKEIARRQMAAQGSAALSTTAIARELGVTQPAFYRYFASRDALITVLIVDAYNDLADTLESAAPAGPAAGRLAAVLLAYRAWALAHPVDFSLIYGNPIPGYEAPRQLTLPPAQRAFAVILNLLAQARATGELSAASPLALPPGLQLSLPTPSDPHAPAPDSQTLYAGLVGWYHVHGLVVLELYGHNTPLIGDMDHFYRHEVATLLRQMGFDPADIHLT
jgi:AcrR family transcriptional regulator